MTMSSCVDTIITSQNVKNSEGLKSDAALWEMDMRILLSPCSEVLMAKIGYIGNIPTEKHFIRRPKSTQFISI